MKQAKTVKKSLRIRAESLRDLTAPELSMASGASNVSNTCCPGPSGPVAPIPLSQDHNY